LREQRRDAATVEERKEKLIMFLKEETPSITDADAEKQAILPDAKDAGLEGRI